MNKIATFRLCKLTDEELLRKVDALTDEMFESQTVPRRYIPARPDADYDLLVGELLKRYQDKQHQADQLAEKNETLKQALHRDQTGLAASLAEINKTLEGYHWVTEGRGPYAWNDERYKGEMLTMLTTLGELANKGLRESGIRSHAYCCEKSKTYEQLQQANDQLAEALRLESWIEVEERTPVAYKIGDYDGKQSDLVWIFDAHRDAYDIARVYEGYLDGNHFKYWYDGDDFEISAPTHWKPLRSPSEQTALTNYEQGKGNDGWISVEERLPQNGQIVQLFSDGVMLTFFKFWEAGSNGNTAAYFADMNDRGPIGLEEITHWRPLPAPPTNYEQNNKTDK